jgi:dUTPase
MTPTLKVRRRPGLDDLPLPQYMSDHAAGLDLHAVNDEPISIARAKSSWSPPACTSRFRWAMRDRSGPAVGWRCGTA